MRRQIQQEQGATQVIEIRRRMPLRYKAAAIGASVLSLLVVAGKVADRVPSLPNVGPRVERETKEGLSTVIARELALKKEFRGDKKTYAVTAELTKRETVGIGPLSKTKQDKAFISTIGWAEGVVDFAGINESSITVAPDNRSVIIRLPHARADNISASHAEEDVKIMHDTNRWCDLSISCEEVRETDLLQLADDRLRDTVDKDPDLLPTAERQAEEFLESLINDVGLPLLRNQKPGFEPSRIDVQLVFGDSGTANPTMHPNNFR